MHKKHLTAIIRHTLYRYTYYNNYKGELKTMKRRVHDTSVVYYWFDHLLLRHNGDAEKVQQAIAAHDFDTFMKFVNKYPTYVSKDGVREIYFPEYAHVFDEETDEEIGKIYIMNRENFNKIDSSDFECG